jgi:hypothetical protein
MRTKAGVPYERAVAGQNAIHEMQKTLAAFGCSSFGTMTDNDRGCMIVAFKWRDQQVSLEANWIGYVQLLMKAGWRDKDKALKQAQTSVCSILRDWVKGQTTAVECGVISFHEAFMPYMLLKNGQRVIDAAKAANLLPAPPSSNVMELKR